MPKNPLLYFFKRHDLLTKYYITKIEIIRNLVKKNQESWIFLNYFY